MRFLRGMSLPVLLGMSLSVLPGMSLSVLAALGALAGCTILTPQPDLSRFYVLTSTVAPEAALASSGAANRLTLGLGPIRFPDYLARSQLVTRVGANQVEFADEERWAEPLERNFARVLGENLAHLLDTERIITLPAFVPVTVQYELPMEVLRFETDDKGVIELWVRWAIRDPVGGTLFHSSESRITETAAGNGTDAVVAALSRAVGKLSEEMAGAIGKASARS